MSTVVAPRAAGDAKELLKPYLPRLLVEWLRDTPDAKYRAVEGSLAFVDISGFTALTELLARRGRVGAEVLRDTLDDVFRALLDEAYGWGAGLLKWGGDALLLLYKGPDHEIRAARAAWEMQRIIANVGRLRVGSASVTLRMSVGISSGPIDFFMAGSVHRELMLIGATVSDTVSAEAAAEAGEIGISEALARVLDPAWLGRREDGLLLLAAPPEASRDPAPDVGSVEDLDVVSCIPAAARTHVLLESSEPEHRTITAAFIELMNTDVLLGEIGPEALAEAFDERISLIQEAALRHEVPFNLTDVAKGGVKTLLTAGAPASTGRDEERTLRALREIMDVPGVIPLRAGVNTGRVFAGDFGPPYRRAYSVFGDAVNTAARVLARAEPGQVLATEVVLDRSRTVFETAPIEPFRAKGKADLVHASSVGAIVGTRDDTTDAPLIGRELELSALLSVFDGTAGRGWIVDLAGPPGIGKSRLVREVVRRVRGMRVLRARCEEYERSTPYYAATAVMRAALGAEGSASDEDVALRLQELVEQVDPNLVVWLPLVGILLGLDLPMTPEAEQIDARFLPQKLAELAERLIAATDGGAAALMVVEDAQHIDEASADLFRRLVHDGSSSTLLVTHADDETSWVEVEDEEQPYLAFTLRPLTEARAIELVEAATEERPLLPHQLEEIARRSGGSPLFLFELVGLAYSSDSAESLPDSLEAVIAADIDRLSPPDRSILRAASVLGLRVDRRLLSAALDGGALVDDGVWERLRGLLDPDPDGDLRFRNTVVRDGAYSGLPYRRRRDLHLRVGEAIEAAAAAPDEEAPALALHFSEAGQYDKAWRYCRVAGDHARGVAATAEATRFYELAVAAGRRLRELPAEERASVWQSLGAVREAAGMYDESFDALSRASRLLAAKPVERARVYVPRAMTRIRTGAYSSALRETMAGLRLIDGADEPEAVGTRAALLSMRSQVLGLQGHARAAIETASRAMDDARRAQELEALGRAYTVLDEAYQMIGEPEKAVHERMALDIYRELGQLRAAGITELNLGVQAYAEGRWDEAIDWYRLSQVDCIAAGDRQSAAVAATNLGEVLISSGLIDEAEATLSGARRTLRATGATPFRLFAETQLARAMLMRGQAREAVDALTSVLEEAGGIGHVGIAMEPAVYFAQAATLVGRPLDGLAAVDGAAERAGEEAALFAVPVDRVRGTVFTALGRFDEAAESLDRALAAAQRQSLLYEQLLILRERQALAVARSVEPDAEELREANRLAQLLGL